MDMSAILKHSSQPQHNQLSPIAGPQHNSNIVIPKIPGMANGSIERINKGINESISNKGGHKEIKLIQAYQH
jgi:hypothetical protein